jgi:hypothetical protein
VRLLLFIYSPIVRLLTNLLVIGAPSSRRLPSRKSRRLPSTTVRTELSLPVVATTPASFLGALFSSQLSSALQLTRSCYYSAVPIVEAMAALVIMECVLSLPFPSFSRLTFSSPLQRRPHPKLPRRHRRPPPRPHPPPSLDVPPDGRTDGEGRGPDDQGVVLRREGL